MDKIKKRLAILFGGQSQEHKISLLSSINVIEAIDKNKYDLILIGIDKIGRWILYDQDNYLINTTDPNNINLVPSNTYLAIVFGQQGRFINTNNWKLLPPIDVIFSLLHGTNGEDGSMQGLLQILNIPYVSTQVLGSAICMDKDITKRILRDIGIPVTPYITLLRTENIPDFDWIIYQIGIPFFIKPANQGSSIGITKVNNKKTFIDGLQLAFNYDSKILIEKNIYGRELEIAIMGNTTLEVSVCGEIITNNEFYDYNAKYIQHNQTQIIIPAQLTDSIIKIIRKTAKQVFIALGCSIMARIDLFLTVDNKVLINEVNTLPGFTSVSMFPKLWELSGINYPTLINKLIAFSLERSQKINMRY